MSNKAIYTPWIGECLQDKYEMHIERNDENLAKPYLILKYKNPNYTRRVIIEGSEQKLYNLRGVYGERPIDIEFGNNSLEILKNNQELVDYIDMQMHFKSEVDIYKLVMVNEVSDE